MNYMKILLIYMAAAFSLSVQSTSAPVETPVPTPTAIVDEQSGETFTPGPGETITAEAPAEPTPAPVPEITPNKKYKQLKKGDKGAAVKTLQERLIELGYLPEGSADGSYGNQTYKAVRRFQKNNGLEADGIAGRKTQTYLYENPDVNPETTATPAPTDTPEPTAEPTEEPEPTPEEIPTEAPTEEPTVAPTEAPTEALTDAPTEEPEETELPVETEEPEDLPTAEPTEEPEPTPVRTASAPVTSAPSTVPPSAEPTMSVEDIDPEGLQFQDAPGSIAYNDNDEPLSWLALEDGVQVLHKPRLQKREGKIRVSLDDLAACISRWELTDDGNSVTLEAEGHTLALLNEDAGIVAMIDGIMTQVKDEDFDFVAEGHFISAEFLANALGGEARWAEDENTLILKIPEQEEE